MLNIHEKNKFLKTETVVVKALSEKVNKIHQKNSKKYFFDSFCLGPAKMKGE